MPALPCRALSPNQPAIPFLLAVCDAAASARVQPGRSRCALRLRPLRLPAQGRLALAAASHPATAVAQPTAT
eukprot:scaffold88403_cov34-Phaeocystis_antarctica.AAC.2